LPFSNPIFGGNKLIREAIQSPDFVEGVSGWAIRKDGTTEFNESTFRGSITIVGPQGTIEIILDDAFRPVIKLWNAAHNNFAYLNVPDDANPNYAPIGINSGLFNSVLYAGFQNYGRIYFANEAFGNVGYVRNQGGGQTLIGGNLVLGESSARLRGYNNNGVNLAEVQVNGTPSNNGLIYLRGSTDGTATNTAEIVLGNGIGKSYLRVLQEDWTSMVPALFSNGWTNSGGAVPAEYRIRPDGTLHFRGRLTAGTNTAGTLMFTMPAGYRPVQPGRYMCANGTGTGGAPGQIEIGTSGACTLATPASTTLYLTNVMYSLE
jgi:hypothetical protein